MTLKQNYDAKSPWTMIPSPAPCETPKQLEVTICNPSGICATAACGSLMSGLSKGIKM